MKWQKNTIVSSSGDNLVKGGPGFPATPNAVPLTLALAFSCELETVDLVLCTPYSGVKLKMVIVFADNPY